MRITASALVVVMGSASIIGTLASVGFTTERVEWAATEVAGTNDEPAQTSTPAGAERTPFDEDVARTVTWALDRFDAADLALPLGLEIAFDSTLDTCEGAGGRYFDGPTRPRVVVCATRVDVQTRRILLHELAHAWDAINLTDAERATFQRAKGLRTWFSQDEIWVRRAGEHVADIITWGLLDGPGRIVTVPYDSCQGLADDYQTLTGTPPPAGLPDHCVGGASRQPSSDPRTNLSIT